MTQLHQWLRWIRCITSDEVIKQGNNTGEKWFIHKKWILRGDRRQPIQIPLHIPKLPTPHQIPTGHPTLTHNPQTPIQSATHKPSSPIGQSKVSLRDCLDGRTLDVVKSLRQVVIVVVVVVVDFKWLQRRLRRIHGEEAAGWTEGGLLVPGRERKWEGMRITLVRLIEMIENMWLKK